MKEVLLPRARPSRWVEFGFQGLSILMALLFTTLVLVIAGAPPIEAYRQVLEGAFGSLKRAADILVAWVPLMLVTSGLLLTFTAGLWNIGVEGQIVLGAIAATGLMRALQETSLPPPLILILALAAGMAGGAAWASLAGLLKIYGGVHEIFGGLGLNFVATTMILWLIFGPWKRPGIGSMSGTEPFPERLWLPVLPGLRLSPWALLLALLSIALVYVLLRNTYFGLRLKAIGKNIRAAHLLGVPTARYLFLALLGCGAMAGLAGAIQVTAVYHRLIPPISSGYGYLGLLVAMLANYRVSWSIPVAFFFAALNIGSIQLPITLKLDSTLSGVMQGALVLFVLLMQGARARWRSKLAAEQGDDA
ncbi:ABC transporter permease [Thermoflexus sp.]|uniref:ABC transporter permease n=1 Tax=Thermoflexus sp. TaxID=1969742 RepID=UPI00176B7221|nr:ABC transporter permease [Thermoflexus sp.]